MRASLLVGLLAVAGFGLGACSLLGGTPTLDFDQLRGGMSEDEAKALQPKLDWQCGATEGSGSNLGNRYCDAPLTKLGDMKAADISYLFRDGKLTGAIIEYSPDAWPALSRMMDAKYKHHDLGSEGELKAGRAAWDVKGGVVASSSVDLRRGNVTAIWISSAEMERNFR